MTKVSDLFDVRYGHSLELNRLTITDPDRGIPFISRKGRDNGIAAHVERLADVEPNAAGELTCALSGNGVLSTFIQERPYYTAYHVACLRPLRPFSTAQLLYYCECVSRNRYRYGWGRQANRTVRDITIPSPEDIPAWVLDTSTDLFAGVDRPGDPSATPPLHTDRWAMFRVSDLFRLAKGKRLTKANMRRGRTPFIGAIARDNGLTAYVSSTPMHPGNTITVNYNGAGVAEAFYQPEPFWACDDVNVLYPRLNLTPCVALFIATVIRHEKYRFNYGRKWHLRRMEQSEIRLPCTPDGEPDWAYMERYIRTLAFSSQVDDPQSAAGQSPSG